MLLIGAGQLTEYLATMAQFSGFAVTVCDPREEYRSAWSVAGAKVVKEIRLTGKYEMEQRLTLATQEHQLALALSAGEHQHRLSLCLHQLHQ